MYDPYAFERYQFEQTQWEKRAASKRRLPRTARPTRRISFSALGEIVHTRRAGPEACTDH